MAAIPPKTNIDGLQKSANDLIYAAFARGVKHGRYLEQQERIEGNRRELERVERERDAAIKDIKELCMRHSYSSCAYCKFDTEDYGEEKCMTCNLMDNWEWQGPQEE